jgi:hypothetical protein
MKTHASHVPTRNVSAENALAVKGTVLLNIVVGTEIILVTQRRKIKKNNEMGSQLRGPTNFNFLLRKEIKMKVELFVEYITKTKGLKIINTKTSNFPTRLLNSFRSLKSFIQYINFDCQINESGGCKETPNAKKCCCHDCFYSAGYLNTITDKDLKFYARHFIKHHGFWRKGKGCVLPHEYRSITCLTHHCNGSYSKKDKYKGFSSGIVELREQLYNMRERLTA